MVWLDGARPTLLCRLVEELKEYIGVTTILASHLFEESLRLPRVLLCIVIMPVDHNINAGSDSSVNHSLHATLFSASIIQVASMLDSHRSPDHRHVPIILQPIHGSGVPVLRHPLGPEQRHAPQTYGCTRFVHNLISLHT
jgi:hypothetical protein